MREKERDTGEGSRQCWGSEKDTGEELDDVS